MTAEGTRRVRLVTNTGARRGAAVLARAGESVEIVDVQGRQTAVVVAFNAADPSEALSPALTRGRLNSIMLQIGDKLFSALGRPMLEIEADTVGRHDLLLPAYDQAYYEAVHSAPGHDNDRANLALAARDHGIAYAAVPDPITFFGNVSIRQRGELEIRRPLSEAEDSVTLRALMDVLVVVSASPHDHNQQNDYTPTELLIRVTGDA